MVKNNKFTKVICALLVGATVITVSPFSAFAAEVKGKVDYICSKAMTHNFTNATVSHKKGKFGDDLKPTSDASCVFNSRGWDVINTSKYKGVMSTTLSESGYTKSKTVKVKKNTTYAEVPKDAASGDYVLQAYNNAADVSVKVYSDGVYKDGRDIECAARTTVIWKAVKK